MLGFTLVYRVVDWTLPEGYAKAIINFVDQFVLVGALLILAWNVFAALWPKSRGGRMGERCFVVG